MNMTYVVLFFCRFINVRKKVLLSEKERSAKVASLPPPISNIIQVTFLPSPIKIQENNKQFQ